MLEFNRKKKPVPELPLTAMIDVVFILIIFFMLTTSFMRLESMEVQLPTTTPLPKKATPDVTMAHIYLEDDGRIIYGQRPVDKQELKKTLGTVFQSTPEQRVVVLVTATVSLQTLVDVMDMVYAAGGKNVFVKEWEVQYAPQEESPSA